MFALQRSVGFRARQDSPARAIAASADGCSEALRRLPRGVCIIAFGQGDRFFGLTATSVSPLSLDPPTILMSVALRSPVSQQFLASRSFGVSALAADHDDLAERFSGGAAIAESELRDGVWSASEQAAPTLANAAAAFDCEHDRVIDHRGHAIVVARVRDARAISASSALVCWRGAYSQLGWTEDEISRAIGVTPVRTKPGVVERLPRRPIEAKESLPPPLHRVD
jgi:flavin reductase (DIM6/NTAB) family NADH-FMN oxidoreductase RutF